MFVFPGDPIPTNKMILFVYHREAERWIESTLLNHLRKMRAALQINLLHQLFSGGKTREELAVENLKKCNHVVVVLSGKFDTCGLSSYALTYAVKSFRKKLVLLKAETCDEPDIVAPYQILTLESPNFWKKLVRALDEDVDQVTGMLTFSDTL